MVVVYCIVVPILNLFSFVEFVLQYAPPLKQRLAISILGSLGACAV